MTDTVLYKKVFQKYLCQEAKNYSSLSSNKKDYYDGTHPFFEFIVTHRNEGIFKENINNSLFSVMNETVTIVIEEKEEKISLKIFYKSFSRNAGVRYFKLHRQMKYVTVNKKFGNIYFGEMNNYQNKKKVQKKIRCNFFINESFANLRAHLKTITNGFNTEQNSDFMNEISRIFLDKIDGGLTNLSFGERLLKYHLDKKQIKYPNNFSLFSNFLKGDFKRRLKKFDNRLVDTFMDMNEIHGKKLKKILHTSRNLNISNYKTALKLFGVDWINQDEKLLKDIFDNIVNLNMSDNLISQFNSLLSPKEKKRVFILFKNFNSNNEIDEWTFRDHFVFYTQLKNFGETDIEWESTNESDFRQEHLDWTNKLEHYKKGTYYRIYPKVYQDSLSNFKVNGVGFYPKLLSNSSEYNTESSIQSNCVKGYIGRVSSIIISLRKNSSESHERLTIEYRIHYLKNSDKILIDRVQCLGKYNSRPDETWNEALEILDKQLSNLSNNSNFPFYKLSKVCNNGTILESDTKFNDDGLLEWTFKGIDNSGFQDYF
jgi:hypothetical protein